MVVVHAKLSILIFLMPSVSLMNKEKLNTVIKVMKKQFIMPYLNLLKAYIAAKYYLSNNGKEIDFLFSFFSSRLVLRFL